MTYYLSKQSNKVRDKSNKMKLNPKWKLKRIVNKYLVWNYCETGKISIFVHKWNQYGQGLIDLLHKMLEVWQKLTNFSTNHQQR